MPRHSCQTSTADTRRSYTIGLYETVQQPELIVVGMKQDSAHYLLNEAARRMEQGLRLAGGRGEKLLENIACEFTKVDGVCAVVLRRR